MIPFELALHWANQGHRVLPVSWTGRKRPLIKQWQIDCTTNPGDIGRWWAKWPEARVGLATGEPGFDVLDFDVADGKPGMEQLEKLIDLGLLEPGTFMVVSTPSGGRHLYFEGTQQHNKQNDKTIPGVDFRGVGGMVLAPGNDGYRIIAGATLGRDQLKAVDWLAVAAALAVPETAPEGPPANRQAPPRPAAPPAAPVSPRGSGAAKLVAPASRFDNPAGEESPLDWYARVTDLGQMLVEDGWTYTGTQDGRDYYSRPGKKPSEGVSGNIMINPDGRQTLFNFSSSILWLPTDRGINAGMYLAYRDHGGDVRAAASHIRRTMMPRHSPIPPVNPPVALGQSIPPAPASPTESKPGAELALIEEVPAMIRDFWSRRKVLHDIRWLARERRVSPWATLGAVLAQASCRVGPHVVLPPIVGGVASLNLLVGLVGPSGKGKGAATSVATEFLDVGSKFMIEEIGTSQGIDASFTETPAKGGPIQFNDVAFFYVPEIDTVKAHAEMSGSSLLATLRKVWSGEPLGAKYAGKERRRPVRAHSYRASVVAGIQPRRSGVLLNDLDGGTPQRWLWLPVADPGAIRRTDKLKPPRYSGQPPALDFDVWVPEGEQRGEKDEPVQIVMKSRYEIPVCQQAQNQIIDARELNLISDEANINSHALLTRLKVAALLAFLDRRMEVTDEDWELALPIMWMSNQVRAECQKALEEAEEEENHKRGRGRAMVAMAEQVAAPILRDKRADRIQELGGKALGILQANPGREYSPRELQKAIMDAKTSRDLGADVMAAVLAVPGVTEGPEVSSGGRKIKKVQWQLVTS